MSLACARLVALPPYRTPLTAWASVARSRSMTVIVVLFATPKASPSAPTLTAAAPSPSPLTEGVVRPVHPRRERHGELVRAGQAAAGRADGIDPLRVPGRLRLGKLVTAGKQVEEHVGTGAVGLLRGGDGVAEGVGAGQRH